MSKEKTQKTLSTHLKSVHNKHVQTHCPPYRCIHLPASLAEPMCSMQTNYTHDLVPWKMQGPCSWRLNLCVYSLFPHRLCVQSCSPFTCPLYLLFHCVKSTPPVNIELIAHTSLDQRQSTCNHMTLPFPTQHIYSR